MMLRTAQYFYKPIYSGLSHVDKNQEIFDALKQCTTIGEEEKINLNLKTFSFSYLDWIHYTALHCFFCNPFPPAWLLLYTGLAAYLNPLLPSLRVNPGVLVLRSRWIKKLNYFLVECASPRLRMTHFEGALVVRITGCRAQWLGCSRIDLEVQWFWFYEMVLQCTSPFVQKSILIFNTGFSSGKLWY